MQTVIAISLLVIAIVFLGWRFIGKKLRKQASGNSDSCGPDCTCS